MSEDRKALMENLRDLIDQYWGCAYKEGKEGRDHDTPDSEAQRLWSKIDSALARLGDAPAEPLTSEQIVDEFKRIQYVGDHSVVLDLIDFREGVRFAERFHGITKEPT